MIGSPRSGMVVTAAIACLALSARAASALPIMLDRGNDGLGVVTIIDNGAGDLDPDPGELIYTGNVSGFMVDLTSAASNSPSFPGPATLSLLQMNLSSATGGVLKVSENDYATPGSAGVAELNGETSGTLYGSGSVAVTQYVDLTNTEFGTAGTELGPAGPIISSGTSGPGTLSSDLPLAFPYLSGSPSALTQNTPITLGPGSYTAFGINSIVHAPEPASMALFGTGLVVLAALARRRMRKRAS